MKTPFALLINDIHAGKENLQAFNDNWKEAVDLCKNRHIERMILGGDLFQSRASLPLSVIKAVQNFVDACIENNIHLYLVVGNHDKEDQEEQYSYCHIFKYTPNVTIVDKYSNMMVNNELILHLMAYFPENGTAMERVESIVDAMDYTCQNYLYFHQGISGALSKPAAEELPAKLFREFDAVFVGHYHDRTKVKPNIEYIGASRQHTYGEDEEKGYTILYTDGSTEFVKNQVNTRYVTCELDVEDLDTSLDRIQDLLDNPQYRVRLKIHVPKDAPEIDRNKLLEMGVNRIEMVCEELEFNDTTESSLDTKFDKSSIKDEYRKFCESENIDPENGLNYLDKIN